MPHRVNGNPPPSLRPLACYPAPSQPSEAKVTMHAHPHSHLRSRVRGQEEYWERVGERRVKEEGKILVHVGSHSHPHAYAVVSHNANVDVHEVEEDQTLVSVLDGHALIHNFPFSFSDSSSSSSSSSSGSFSRSSSTFSSSSSSFSSSSSHTHLLQRSRGTDTSLSFSPSADLQAALVAEPDNPEAKALLHQRSVAVEKLLAPLPKLKDRLSPEIWREIARFLPRRDLKSLLFVPHAVSRVASQLLFRELDLHFSAVDGEDEVPPDGMACERGTKDDSEASRHAQRSADILTRIITDPGFAIVVRTLRIYATRREGDAGMAFQTGMLTNALPKLVNLRNVHVASGAESVVALLKILQNSSPRLKGLSINSPDGPADLSFLDLGYLSHFSYSTLSNSSTVAAQISTFLAQNRTSLRTVHLENPHPSPYWTFPSTALSIRNLTSIHFAGSFPATSYAFSEILTNGKQLEDLTLNCCMLESTASSASQQFRAMLHSGTLPFLRNFAFAVSQVGKRTMDRDLFPAVAEFLRSRTQLKTLKLVAYEESVQRAVGFDASVWGVLPTLTGLKGLTITYPNDLAPGLAAWLIPRSVTALTLTLDYVNGVGRDPASFFSQLRTGIPPTLKYIGLSDLPVRNVSAIIEHGFPMVRVLRVGSSYWTVNNVKTTPQTSPQMDTAHTHHSVHTHHHRPPQASGHELDPWPRRRVLYHAQEWLEWLGCEDAITRDRTAFPVC